MAWIKGEKTYAILCETEKGKDIIEKAPEMSDEELKTALNEYFNNNGLDLSDEEFYGNKDIENESNKFEKKDFYENRELSSHYKDSLSKMLENKHFKQTAEKLTKGKFNNDYTFNDSDYKFFVDMFNGNAKPDDLRSTGLYKYFEDASTAVESLEKDGNEDLIKQGAKEFKEIITKGKTGPEFKQGKLTIITGLPSAGKSSEEIIPYLERGIELDNDIAKKVPALAGKDKYNDGLGASVVHLVAKEIEKQVTAELIQEGYNVVIPMVGAGEESIIKRVKNFIDSGNYKEDPVWIHKEIDNDTSRMRSFKRAVETGRYIRDDYIKEYGNEPNETYKRAVKNKGVVESDGRKIKFKLN